MKKKFILRTLVATFVLLNLTLGSEAIFAGGKAGQKALWQKVAESKIPSKGLRRLFPEKYETFSLNQTTLKETMSAMPLEFTAAEGKAVIMDVPMPDGTISKFRIEETQVLADHLAKAFPSWKTFRGFGVDDPSATAQFDWTSAGFHGYIFTDNDTIYIDPFQMGDAENYLVYYKHDFGVPAIGDFSCQVGESLASQLAPLAYNRPDSPAFASGTAVRTYRLAIATTGQWARSTTASTDPQTVRTAALAAMTTSVNRINGIYIREIGVTFQLVNPPITDNARNIIFDDPATAPYDNTDSVAQLMLNQTIVDARVGTANYDVGHLYGTGGGGVAYAPSVCSPQKAGGYSAREGNVGDPFTVDYVAHEIGHQFGGSHTYNNRDNGGACTTRSVNNAFEVASGSTIMSYVGICNIRNLQQYVDVGIPQFHIRSLTQMVANIQDPDAGGSCGTPAGTNNIPTVNAGTSFTIPRLTPFTLTATGTDADAADVPNLLYSWEEYDLAPSGTGQLGTPALGYDVDTDGVLRPLFRAYSPVSSQSRTFPSLPFILNPANNAPAGSNNPPLQYQGTSPTGAPGAVCQAGNDCVIGENLPSAARTMNFRVAIRDQRGGIADAGTTVTIAANTGPFQVTAQNDPMAWGGGTTQTVTWNVAGTDAAPISAANVKVSLSTDGGFTFPTVLLASTPNTGTAPITVPNTATTQARIKVEAVGNIFFDINNANFQITTGGPNVNVGDGSASGGLPPPMSGQQSSSPTVSSVPFVITLSAPRNQPITLTMSTHSITATEGVDFVSEDGLEVVFPPNTLTQTVQVPIIHQPGHQPNETFALDIVTANGATIGDGEGIGTIIDNDAPVGTESDLAPRPSGNGTLESGDVVIERQAVVGSITLDPATTEFQRADSAPAATGGDGQLDATDIIQTRRYVAGIDPPQLANGPVHTLPRSPLQNRNLLIGKGPGRMLRAGSARADIGRTVTLPIELVAKGDEAATSFTLTFDAEKLRNPRVSLAPGGASNAVLTVNVNDAMTGKVVVLLDTGATLTTQLVNIKFDVAQTATPGDTKLAFDSDAACISNSAGQSLDLAYQDGIVTIERSAKVEAAGRVLGADGRGIRNARVTVTDKDGNIQTTATSSFGYFRFGDLSPGETYTISVTSRQYRFAARVVQMNGDLADVDFAAIE